ncbi:DNA polymerase delta, subunit 4-domain-containing protein [Corynascus novoguineensis]|uniref:DNA polymerase delta, subunit 4-domain-containing protein n=1 Tax=Corynascus novoguineensis TaxID=1126955 RepID=A0AAN7HL20_9PEZI|nr:DNA polymerase delta, subunit 4-domain-containing protein [Corynascus novoguineensis]
MPTTRRSTRSSTGAGKQSTLSFKHKVTKAIQTGKEGYKSPSRAKEYIPEPSPEPAVSKREPKKEEEEEEEETPVPTDDEQQQEKAQPTAVATAQGRSEAEVEAAKITDRAIERYWNGIESSRKAKAVHKKHTEGLTTGEKVLRYFDVSSQYGPCIGITRLKRWQRAQRLGLNPPVEVLAVLLKEEAKGNTAIEKAHMDELLNSAAVGSVGV